MTGPQGPPGPPGERGEPGVSGRRGEPGRPGHRLYVAGQELTGTFSQGDILIVTGQGRDSKKCKLFQWEGGQWQLKLKFQCNGV